MKKAYEINGREIEFTKVTAIWHNETENGRREAILIHDNTDKFCDGDGVVFGVCMPEDKADAENLLSEVMETYFETMATIEYV